MRALFSVVLAILIAAPAHAQISPLPHIDESELNSFGSAVAIDGNRAVAAATGEDICGPNSGAVYVFEHPGDRGVTGWEKTARLTAPNCRPGAFFGRSIALDGDRLLVSSTVEFFADEKPHAAYVFEVDDAGEWTMASRLSTGGDIPTGSFAASVALDGDRALITAQGHPTSERAMYGGAYVFERDSSGQWRSTVQLHGRHRGNHTFGAVGVLNGDRIAVTAPAPSGRGGGGVHLFERTRGNNWSETAYLDGFEDAYLNVALEGNRLIVGEGFAGPRGEGRVHTYERSPEGRWVRTQTLLPTRPYQSGSFGMHVSLNGTRLLATGYDEQLRFEFNIDRVVYVFRLDEQGGGWQQQQIIDIGEVDFGTAIDHDGDLAIVGHVSKRGQSRAYIVGLR